MVLVFFHVLPTIRLALILVPDHEVKLSALQETTRLFATILNLPVPHLAHAFLYTIYHYDADISLRITNCSATLVPELPRLPSREASCALESQRSQPIGRQESQGIPGRQFPQL